MAQSAKSVEHRLASGVLVVTLTGAEFVLEQAQTIADLVFGRYEGETDRIVMDLTSIIYINSSGISVIIRSNLEKKLKLVNVSQAVRDILDLTGILPFISEYTSVDDAVAAFQEGD